MRPYFCHFVCGNSYCFENVCKIYTYIDYLIARCPTWWRLLLLLLCRRLFKMWKISIVGMPLKIVLHIASFFFFWIFNENKQKKNAQNNVNNYFSLCFAKFYSLNERARTHRKMLKNSIKIAFN